MVSCFVPLCTDGVVKGRYVQVEKETLNTYFTTDEKVKCKAKSKQNNKQKRQGHNIIIIGNGNDDEEISVLGVSTADRTHK